MFRRRRRAAEETAPTGAEVSADAVQDVQDGKDVQGGGVQGPWDSDDDHPEAERIDLGGLQLPVGPGFEVQLNVAGDRIIGAVVLVAESALEVRAFAAPKRSGIWDEVRAEITREVTAAGGTVADQEGPFGAELVTRAAKAPVRGARAGGKAAGADVAAPHRHIGVDGPRWLLHAVLSGRAALDPAAAQLLEDVIRGIVVVRGDEPMAPKESLELRLPAEARQAMEQQAAENPEFKPFERGPEITEIR